MSILGYVDVVKRYSFGSVSFFWGRGGFFCDGRFGVGWDGNFLSYCWCCSSGDGSGNFG